MSNGQSFVDFLPQSQSQAICYLLRNLEIRQRWRRPAILNFDLSIYKEASSFQKQIKSHRIRLYCIEQHCNILCYIHQHNIKILCYIHLHNIKILCYIHLHNIKYYVTLIYITFICQVTFFYTILC